MKHEELPIVEIFDSVQGEGVFQGTSMTFVRLAGCPVGRASSPNDPYVTCTTFDGKEFTCDTDFRVREIMSVDQIAEWVTHDHVCITGGEPFAQQPDKLVELVEWLLGDEDTNPENYREIHWETSGTKPIAPVFRLLEPNQLAKQWVACSPKAGYLPENDRYIDEFKFLVEEEHNLSEIDKFVSRGSVDAFVFLQPVNHIGEINQASLERVKRALVAFPQFRLSLQLHKILGVK